MVSFEKDDHYILAMGDLCSQGAFVELKRHANSKNYLKLYVHVVKKKYI